MMSLDGKKPFGHIVLISVFKKIVGCIFVEIVDRKSMKPGL